MKIRFNKNVSLRGIDMGTEVEQYYNYTAGVPYNFDIEKNVEKGKTLLTLVSEAGIVFPAVDSDLIE